MYPPVQKHRPRSCSFFDFVAREISVFFKLLMFFGALFAFTRVCAQTYNPCPPKEGDILDPGGPSGPRASDQRRVVPYPYLREADVMWSKRIWRTIDLREKMNHPYYYPEAPHNGMASLFDIIKGGILYGCITAFDNPAMDDEFKVPMNVNTVKELLMPFEIIQVEDPNFPGTWITDTIENPIESTHIKAYWVKEDWFFDKQRSVMDVRIIGLCPLKEKTDPTTGEVIGYMPLFWIYFPQIRPLLVRHEVYLGQNNAQRLTYDDMFQKRFFGSYIHKESNVYDRPVNSYSTGLDALLESESIKEDIMNTEHDLWHY
jgi:gliding motility associated protien GldN